MAAAPDTFYAGDEESLFGPARERWKSPHEGVLLLPFLQNWKTSSRAAFFAPAAAAGIKIVRLRRSPNDALLLHRASRDGRSWLLAVCPLGAPATALAMEFLRAGGVRTAGSRRFPLSSPEEPIGFAWLGQVSRQRLKYVTSVPCCWPRIARPNYDRLSQTAVALQGSSSRTQAISRPLLDKSLRCF